MITHIVCWKLKPEAAGRNAPENAREIKKQLEALVDTIPQIRDLEVGINFNDSPMAYDISLYSRFDNREALDTYQAHPAHQKVKSFVGAVTEARVVVDYE